MLSRCFASNWGMASLAMALRGSSVMTARTTIWPRLQGPRGVPVLQRAAHGPDGGAPYGPDHVITRLPPRQWQMDGQKPAGRGCRETLQRPHDFLQT